ncbi:TonB-dependent receptor [Massilia sp. METH4]|uniref:TonB-dependent receptor n=1 Tax=Massilia sp. METH4 TaxID=3123041 RepID=UPI0030D51B9A
MSYQHGKHPVPKRIVIGILQALSTMGAAGWLATPATAQDTQPIQRVEITGSSIKRLAAETALPVQTITRADIEKSSVTTAAELLSKVSANTAALTDGASFSDIAGQRGFNGANLRGIGVSSTLVLLNGRRLANFASPGGNAGVDLNAIPSAAIDRVEVLKDGASAIYGTDAIGGVINFITRRNYEGGEANVYYADTEHGGARKATATLSGGIGNLETDRYNVLAVFDYQDTTSLRSSQRKWIGSAYQPDINLDSGSSNTFPANVRRTRADGTTATGPRLNPSAPTCNPPATVYAPDSFVGPTACMYDYMQDTELFPESRRVSLLTRGQFALDKDTTLYGEFLVNETKTTYRISALTVSGEIYPLNGQYYPHQLITTNKTPLVVNMRLTEGGPRTNEIDATATRLVVGAKGIALGWDYDAALNHSVNKVDDHYIDGYVRTSLFDAAFARGVINPFGPSGPEGQALLAEAKINDPSRRSRGTTDSFDIKATRDLFAMAGGNAAIALGAEYRREKMRFTPSALLAAGEIRGEGEATPFSGGRNVKAVYAELNLPLLASVEAQLALRHDRYNDVGSTTNPKVGVRWNPMKQVVVRGSYGTGFRAPSLADLYGPVRLGQANGIYNDPLGCIVVGGIDNTENPDYCGLQPDKLRGGSASLRPEESKQFSLGVVLEPHRDITLSLDYWRIKKTDVIVSPEGSYFTDPVSNAAYIIRDVPDPALPGIPGKILSIDSRLRNIGALETSGADLGISWRPRPTPFGKFGVSLNGTYVNEYKTREAADGPEVSALGVYTNDQIVQRWRHTLSLDYDRGPVSVTLQQTYLSGYRDQNLLADGSVHRVDSYSLLDLSGGYQITRALKLRAGIKNLLDKNPPRSNQLFSFAVGFDPSYTDPRGRQFYGSLAYAFR